jgi:hypothetical protein
MVPKIEFVRQAKRHANTIIQMKKHRRPSDYAQLAWFFCHPDQSSLDRRDLLDRLDLSQSAAIDIRGWPSDELIDSQGPKKQSAM